MECMKEKNVERCTCTNKECKLYGLCCECIARHTAKRQLPGCCFPTEAEATWDRSFEHFARLVNENKV